MKNIDTLIDASNLLDNMAKFYRLMEKAGATIEHLKMLINNRTARTNLIAYLEAGCPKLTNMVATAAKKVVYGVLKPVGQTEIQQRTAEFNPKAFFQTNQRLCIRGEFNSLVLKYVEPVSNIPAMTLGKFQPVRNAYDWEIKDELPTEHVLYDASILCAVIAGLIQQQLTGKGGTLLNNGGGNLFYLIVNGHVVVVRVHWHVRFGVWYVSAYRFGGLQSAGDQVLSATAS